MAYHAFVAMPFGIKEQIDFNRVYGELIKPALEDAGFEVFRADEEMRAGDIRTDMFQELLMADLVVADLSIDNPNVWYELGVRHALRARGVIGIMCRRNYMPFDVYTDRVLTYQIKDNPPGAAIPDPERLEDGKKKLAEFATQTMDSWYERKISPVYHLLPALKEPHFKLLQVEGAKEFWSWAMRIEVARKGNRPGDILVFAEEAPNIGLRVEAYRSAGNGLRSLGQFALALDQYEKALALAPDDLESRRQKGLLLGRLKQSDAAKEWLQNLVKEVPDDAESWALLGRVEKDSWISGWRADGKTVEQMQEDAAADDAVLQETINSYAKGFRKDPSHYYSGINAVALMHLLSHLTGKEENLEVRKEMEGGVRWAVRGALEKDSRDYWARATLAELEGLSNKKEVVDAALKSAVAVADRDWFKLNSSREQLLLYKDLGFRPVEVQAHLEIIDRALARAIRPEARWAPRQVFLFSGHMIDAPDRKDPRFPPDKEPIAAKAIADRLDALGAGAEDLAICSGACGGDLLFAEACLARGLRLELRIPFDEPTFLRNSVAFAPGNWTDRFYQVKGNPNTKLLVMPDELGPTPKEANPYARDNLWQLHAALSWGPDKVRFVCLWNRKGGDGPGGTGHMYETVQKYSGRVYVLDTNLLW
ncbi:MAG TPA: TRAFs-binding domain-containing protein [Candidatus Binatia bacterium]|nr:TRAFs-binding domain-containing protein [Candidatus Binatia bacterium]